MRGHQLLRLFGQHVAESAGSASGRVPRCVQVSPAVLRLPDREPLRRRGRRAVLLSCPLPRQVQGRLPNPGDHRRGKRPHIRTRRRIAEPSRRRETRVSGGAEADLAAVVDPRRRGCFGGGGGDVWTPDPDPSRAGSRAVCGPECHPHPPEDTVPRAAVLPGEMEEEDDRGPGGGRF